MLLRFPKSVLAILALWGGVGASVLSAATGPTVRSYAVASIPAASTMNGQLVLVSDGSSATDCTTGGGTFAVNCKSNGTSWSALQSGSAGTGATSATPVWRTFSVSFTNISAASTSAAYSVLPLSAKQMVCGLVSKTTTAFAGTGIGTLTVTVGDSSGTATTYSNAPYNLLAAVSNTNLLVGNVLGMASYAGGNVQVNATASGANLSALTAGALSLSICTVTLP